MSQTRSRSRLWAVAPLAMLVFAGWQTATTLAREPAFNRSLLVESATGGTLPGLVTSMYSQADYLRWIAFEWYHRTGTDTNLGEDESTQQKEAIQARFRRTRDTATESLRRSPGDPIVWMLLAKAEAALGDGEYALQAYQKSNNLAPHNAPLAHDRLYFLSRFMSEPESRDLALSMIAAHAVHADLDSIQMRFGSGQAKRYSEDPGIRAFNGDAEGRD